jgi:GNAT superfamily N-acetyltransferase
LSLRPATPADRDFLLRVYASTREQELAQVPFSAAEKAAFLEQQFAAQSVHYERGYTDLSYDLVLVDGEPAGRLIVSRWPAEVRVVDIALLPEHRGHGVGGRLMRPVLDEADERGVKASIHVEQGSPALRFYRRLGFAAIEDRGIHLLMERPPPDGQGQAKTAS